MQVYRGLPILTNQSERPDAPRRRSGRSTTRRRSPSTSALAHAAIDEVARGAAGRRRRRRHRALPARGAVGARASAAAARPARASGSRRSTTASGPSGAHALLAERDPPRPRRVHPNDRRRVVRALELAETGASLRPGDDRLWSDRHAAPDADRRARRPARASSSAGSRRAPRRCSSAGWRTRSRSALAEPISRPPAHVLGLDEVAELPARPRRRGRDRRADAPLRRLPAQVDAADPRPRYRSRRPASGGGRRCNSRSGTRSGTPTCSSSGLTRRSSRSSSRLLCDPHRGVGSDGVLEVEPDGTTAGVDGLEPGRLAGRVLRQRRPDRRALARRTDGRGRGRAPLRRARRRGA